MKMLLLLISFLLFTLAGIAQTFQAHYKVSRVIDLAGNNLEGSSSLNLELNGFLYQKGNKFISFTRPSYREKYPSGTIEIPQAGQPPVTKYLYMDSVQAISYINLDSLVMRYRNDGSGQDIPRANYVREFETGSQKWVLLPATREISGLRCQKAVLYRPTNASEIVYEIWFCPDIEKNVGIRGLRDVPGLVVEASIVPLKESWSLVSYSSNPQIPDRIFWPKEFEQPFKRIARLQRQP